MKCHVFSLSLATLATTLSLIAPGTAQGATLSQQATNLATLNPASSQYSLQYNSVLNAYNSQAASYSLAFDDWFAMNSFINNETIAYGSNGAKLGELVALDLNALTWQAGASNVEVFFINEGAGYRNKFGYSTTNPADTTQAATSDPLLNFWNQHVDVIWQDVAAKNSILAERNGPLTLGQGYMIGDVAAGDTVNFFLRNPYSKVFDGLTADTTFNKDGLQHVTTYQYGEFLVLAYEDIYGGGDLDYNDVVIAVRGLVDTQVTPDPTTVPEPIGVLGLFGVGLLGIVTRRQRA